MPRRRLLICLSPVLLALAACTQAAPARTGESAAKSPETREERTAVPNEPTPAKPAEAPVAVEGISGAGQPVSTAFVLEPPDGKWLTDENGQQYFILEVPRVEGQYVWVADDEVRLRGGLPLKLVRHDDKTFYAKIIKVEPGAGSPLRAKPPSPQEIEKATESYKITLPTVTRLRLVPFDAGLPRRGQWRNGFDIADMNGDGQLDIVHGAARKGSPGPVIFLGDGKGTWRIWTEARFPGDIRYDYGDTAAADFNGDGHMDVALSMHILGLRAFVGDGKGAFKLWSEGLDYRKPKAGDPPPGFSSRAIEAVDWDGDKRPDVLALGEGMHLTSTSEKPEMAANSSFGPAVYLNGGRGTWVRKDQGTDSRQIFGDSLATGDFDGDGRLDFVTAASFVGRQDIIHLGRGDSWETVKLELRPRGYVTAVAAADFDGDGRDDAAVAYINSELGVLRSGIDIFLARPGKDGLSWERRGLTALDGRLGFYALAAGDLDGDKSADLVALTGEGQVNIFLAESQGFFARAELPAGVVASEPGCRGYDVHVVDIDRDGRGEIVADFAGEQGTAQILQSLGPEGVKVSCPSEGSIRAWKTVVTEEAK
ncbi:MAG TPA: VCBS repeat-containing protein [Thermoanaerobaculia bacterium]|nr:VCBS repeat-containing protein [Thermoanaerobaculia bacterium]